MSGDLKVEQTEYGSWRVTTTSGDVYKLDDLDGALLVRVDHGGVMLKPQASNSVEVHGRLARGADW